MKTFNNVKVQISRKESFIIERISFKELTRGYMTKTGTKSLLLGKVENSYDMFSDNDLEDCELYLRGEINGRYYSIHGAVVYNRIIMQCSDNMGMTPDLMKHFAYRISTGEIPIEL